MRYAGETSSFISAGETSSFVSIQVSVIQGSGLSPASFLVTAANLLLLHGENKIIKYADDTYLIMPACNTNACFDELEYIRDWATKNNLRLNYAKTKEILFQANVQYVQVMTSSSHHPARILKESPAW